MENDFKEFMKKYVNGDFKKYVISEKGTLSFDTSTQENTLKSVELLESEILKTNLNLLYAYHQWLNSKNN